MLLELGNDASDNGGILAGNGGETGAGGGGGEHGGIEEGGDIEVTSTMSSEGDRERTRLSDE